MECDGHAMESPFHPGGVSPILHQLQGKIQDTCEQRCTQQIPGVTGSLPIRSWLGTLEEGWAQTHQDNKALATQPAPRAVA